MSLIPFITIICLIVSVMIVWFRSDAFVEWMKLFGFGKFIKSEEYLNAKLENDTITYPLFLKLKYTNFIFKILGCPLCLCIWLSLFGEIFSSSINSPSVPELISETIIYLPIIYVLSLYIYYILSKLLNENK